VAEFLGPDSRPIAAEEARALLSAGGTELHPLSAEDQVVLAMFGDDHTADRGESDLSPPEDETAAASGMAAWHVNERAEAHTVRSGTGLMQFITESGPVSVVLQPGDVIVIRGAEHRYRPLTVQRWALRWPGGADADLGARETGRTADAWPVL
jgi:mannose-6-phosphate isomerase-like protein (cupin superfamily)